ncbi:Acetyl-coenzyme A transporter 1 [Geodia barretti]|uniref:Acetyl-coenzyme A transporter 1 n=1 Tax=Geodia barretti TaxID=519541 RepID=A0AA35TIH2_GEOBA|nr:Acetyl-coenzyme A transporter 1 [Geodia barretti]
MAAYSMFVATMAFHAKISDPAIGGTYMTLLNTVSNLAGMWPGTLSLWLVDNVSFKDCEGVTDFSLDCDTMQELQALKPQGGPKKLRHSSRRLLRGDLGWHCDRPSLVLPHKPSRQTPSRTR